MNISITSRSEKHRDNKNYLFTNVETTHALSLPHPAPRTPHPAPRTRKTITVTTTTATTNEKIP